VEKDSKVMVCTSITPKNKEEYDDWYEKEHLVLLTKVPGWTRTRRFELIDALINGKDAQPNNGDAEEVPLCLGLHGE